MQLTLLEVSKLLKRLEEMQKHDKIFEEGTAKALKVYKERNNASKITPLAFSVMATLEKHIPTMSDVSGSGSNPNAVSEYISTAKEFISIF